MTIGPRHALSEIRKNYSSLNWWRNRVFVPYIVGTASRFHPRYPGYDNAVHVMDEEWDNLIVLDACRADFFQEVADLERFDEYSTRVSLGSHSSEFTRRNFQGKEFGDTVYVSANPHTALEAGDSFHEVIELWETETDEDAGVVLPESVRDAAIEAYEEYDDKRIIAHFMQPHGPFIGTDQTPPYKKGKEYESSAEYWKDYKATLDHVLDYALTVADEIPGRTVITADHGQIFAQGLKRKAGIYSHPPRLRLPELVYVPWAVIDGPRRKLRSGSTNEARNEKVEENLKKLGYK